MCIARLNVSTQTCEHRWYQLATACHPANNLANCPEKLQLEGWETRTETCPWCDSVTDQVHESTHRLFGSVSSASFSSASSSSSTPTSPDLSGLSRSWSWRSTASDGTMSPLSRASSTTSMESDWGQKHRGMNERLDIYLSYDPHEILPSAAKNYPSNNAAQGALNGSTPGMPLVRRTNSAMSKRWRSVRNSVDRFRV